MSEKIYPVFRPNGRSALIVDDAKYRDMYARSIKDPDGFWGEHGKRLDWIKPFTKVKNTSYAPAKVSIKWFEDGVLNVAANCIDRHLPSAATRSRSSGKATIPPTPRRSPIASCTTKSAASPMC